MSHILNYMLCFCYLFFYLISSAAPETLRIKSPKYCAIYWKIAPGSVANGFAAKFAVACDSKTAVLHTDFDRKGRLLCHIPHGRCVRQSNPSPIPARLCKITIQSTRNPDVMIFSAFTATIPLMIMTMDTTEISGRMPDNFSICLPISLRRRIPRRTGISTTFTTEITIPGKDT